MNRKEIKEYHKKINDHNYMAKAIIELAERMAGKLINKKSQINFREEINIEE